MQCKTMSIIAASKRFDPNTSYGRKNESVQGVEGAYTPHHLSI
jgi:hypothetical protein